MHQPSAIHVLLIDDDRVLAKMLSQFLETEALRCSHAATGEDALVLLEGEQVDIAVLDIMMPGMGGIETLKAIRAKHTLPVIMLTARGDDIDRIIGLELGADDYLPKPCNPRELLARIRAVVRRSAQPATESSGLVSAGDITLNPATRSVEVRGDTVDLTQTEFDLLLLLARQPDQLVSKQDISRQVLGKSLSQWDRSIDVHISNIRRKIGLHPVQGQRIRTLRGSGYLLVSQPAVADSS